MMYNIHNVYNIYIYILYNIHNICKIYNKIYIIRCFLGHHGKNMGKQIGKWSGKHISCANITNSMGISPTVVLFVVYPTSFHGGCKSRNITG